MATLTWKGGAFLFSAIIGSIVGIRKLITNNENPIAPPEQK